MKKPADYDTYFFPDGTQRENPYPWGDDIKLFIKNIEKTKAWSARQIEIKKSLMSDEEREKYDRFLDRVSR